MMDRADCWHAGKSITGKTSEILQEAINATWLQTVGPLKKLTIDGEKRIDIVSARALLARHGIDPQFKAKGQLARTDERRGAILRQCLHLLKAQLAREGTAVTASQLLSHGIFTEDALTNTGGGTPYNARYGTQPCMLPDLMAPADGETRLQTNAISRATSLRKIA